MNGTSTYFKSQYKLTQQSRRILFDYCRTITNVDFLNQNNSFGRGGSIRNLLVHIANTCEFWIIKHARKKDITFTEYTAKNTTPFELFTHVITHEFHHKGQVLSLSRHLGYIPVDTDIIR